MKLLQHKWARISLLVAGTIAAVYAMIYVDVVMRAREAFNEGEKYWSWHENPAQKKMVLEQELEQELARLKKEHSRGTIDTPAYDQKVKLARFTFTEKLNEISIKYAYVWYQTAVELFSPPESRWVRQSRIKMKQAKELWKEELRSNNIPFED